MEEKRCLSACAAEIIEGNEELLIEILVLLPSKSLVRFKSVSRRWNLLISGDYFLRLHRLFNQRREHSFFLSDEYFSRLHLLNRQHSFVISREEEEKNRSLLFLCHPSMNKLLRFQFPMDCPRVQVLQSCNGLLLLMCGLFNGCYHRLRRWYAHYYVFNPMTMEHRKIIDSASWPAQLCLLFDPSQSENYKVVKFSRKRSEGYDFYTLRFCAYDSATHEWTNDCGEYPNIINSHDFPNGLNCGRHVYFIGEGYGYRYSLEEDLQRTPKPPPPGELKSRVVESNGHLHCVRMEDYEADVFEMVGDEWVLCASSNGSRLKLKLRIEGKVKLELVGMIREQRMEDSMFLFHLPGRIMIYGFSDEMGRVLVNHGTDFFDQNEFHETVSKVVHNFTHTLASV